MKLILLLFTSLIFIISFGQNEPSQNMPPVEMLQGNEELKNIYELPFQTDFKIYDRKGALIDSGNAQFIDYTNYKAGTYFIKYDNQTKTFEKKQSTNNPHLNTESNFLFIMLASAIVLIVILLSYFGVRLRRYKKEQSKLLQDIEGLKSLPVSDLQGSLTIADKVILDRNKVEIEIASKLNESDWKIIDLLMDHPSISNKELAGRVSLSVEGTRSSLKKMYRIFEIPSSRNMRLTLVIKLVQISKQS